MAAQPSAPRLILIEGLPGSGKTSLAEFLCSHLLAIGISCAWEREEATDHPVFGKSIRQRAKHPGYGELCARQWSRFAAGSHPSVSLYILEGCFFQSTVRFLLEQDRPFEEALLLSQFWRRFARPLIAGVRRQHARRHEPQPVLPSKKTTWTTQGDRSMRILLLAAVSLLIAAGCTSISVDPLEAKYSPDLICVQFNPDVIVAGFEEAVTERIEHHGIETRMVKGDMPAECHYTLEYTALKNWDMGLYMHYAELHLKLDGREIADATYRLRNKGGLSLFKWQDVKTKTDPVVDQLLGDAGSR